MAKYLNPKADMIFKHIFADHPHLLIDFLNAVMPFEDGRHIIEIEYLPSEMAPDIGGRKLSIVDVRCKDNFGRQFIVEMQMYWYDAFMNRIVFNAGKAYVRQLKIGQDYHLLQPVYLLSILNKNFDHKTDRFYHHYQIVNRENTDEIIQGLEFVLVELTEKFRPETMADRKLMVLWLRFLKEVNENLAELPPEMQENEYISEAAKICERAAYSPEDLAKYDGFWDAVRIEKTIQEGARREGHVEGKREGHVEGKREGHVEGKREGKIEEKSEIALKGLQMGISINDVSKLTGLSIQQIEQLKK